MFDLALQTFKTGRAMKNGDKRIIYWDAKKTGSKVR